MKPWDFQEWVLFSYEGKSREGEAVRVKSSLLGLSSWEKSRPRAERPRQYWGIDGTKSMIPSGGGVYLAIVSDWFAEKSMDWGLSSKSKALEVAVKEEFPDGVRGSGLQLIRDHGAQPKATLGIRQILTSYDDPAERIMRTIKEEVIWLNEFSSFEEVRERIGRWIEIDYNKLYVHSELGYISPKEYEALFYEEALRKTT